MEDRSSKRFRIVSNTVMILMTLCVMIPFLLLFMSSITDENALIRNGYSFVPEKFSLESYAYILGSGTVILRAYGISIFVTAIGTISHILLASLAAYPLSIKQMPGRKILSFFVFFTMLFSGGIVPSYLLWSSTFHVKNTIAGQLLPNLLLSGWNVIMIRTYFEKSIPYALIEAAGIDGASHYRIFRSIVMPLGKPIIISIGTFVGLAYWNDWINGLYYISKRTDLYNVQNLLNNMVSNLRYLAEHADTNTAAVVSQIPTTGVQMALAFVAILPIMMIFPVFSKYYAKGLTVGAVKG